MNEPFCPKAELFLLSSPTQTSSKSPRENATYTPSLNSTQDCGTNFHLKHPPLTTAQLKQPLWKAGQASPVHVLLWPSFNNSESTSLISVQSTYAHSVVYPLQSPKKKRGWVGVGGALHTNVKYAIGTKRNTHFAQKTRKHA